MELIIFISIYLVGYVMTYLIARALDRQNNEKYTKKMRKENILFGLLSWAALIMLFIFYCIYHKDNDEAKW